MCDFLIIIRFCLCVNWFVSLFGFVRLACGVLLVLLIFLFVFGCLLFVFALFCVCLILWLPFLSWASDTEELRCRGTSCSG